MVDSTVSFVSLIAAFCLQRFSVAVHPLSLNIRQNDYSAISWPRVVVSTVIHRCFQCHPLWNSCISSVTSMYYLSSWSQCWWWRTSSVTSMYYLSSWSLCWWWQVSYAETKQMPTNFLFCSRDIYEFAVVVANNATGHGQLGFGNRSVTHISAESIFEIDYDNLPFGKHWQCAIKLCAIGPFACIGNTHLCRIDL